MRVDELNVPRVLKEALLERGFVILTPPQAEAINKGLLKGNSILVVAPTASGKTLIGELALVNAWLSGGKGVYVTPLKALAEEKFSEFKFWERLGLRVGISTGDYEEPGEYLRNYDIIVATYERMDSLFRLRPSWLNNIKTMVVDEFHMIGDEDRGSIVELLLIRSTSLDVQIVGLSATVGRPEVLSNWIGAELVVSNWRPVKLIEGFYSPKRGAIVFSDGRVEKVKGGKKALVEHCYAEALNGDYQLLILVQARNKAEELARRLSLLSPENVEKAKELGEELSSYELPKVEVDSLVRLFKKGVAYHHAGLAHQARKVIEKAFRDRILRAVVATPTLAAGINVPARRVLIYTRRYEEGYLRSISIAEYKQMAGRAGRPQYDPYGEAIIADVASDSEGWSYVRGEVEGVSSSLLSERAARIHTLALIASNEANDVESLMEVFRKSFAAYTSPLPMEGLILRTIEILKDFDMVKGERRLIATPLGLTVSRLYIDPLTAVVILNALRGRAGLKPLYYLVTVAMAPDFKRVRVVGAKQLASDAEVALEMGLVPDFFEDYVEYDDWLRAYKVGRILNAWIDEVPVEDIIEKYGVGSGDLRMIVETADWLTNAAYKVCEVKGLKEHAKRLAVLNVRVAEGVKEELLDLVRVRGIGRVRARLLFEAGIRTVEDLAKAKVSELLKIKGFGPTLAESVIAEAKKLLGI